MEPTFQDKLIKATQDLVRYEVDTTCEEYQKIYTKINLMEATKIRTSRLLSELTAKDIVSRMAMLAQREKRGLTARDLQRVLEASLRFEGMDDQTVAAKVQELMTDQGVTQSVFDELKQMGIQFYM